MPVGIVLRRSRGVTRWAKHVWRAAAVLPGAGPASWKVLREAEGVVEYYAATEPLTLYRSDTEAYAHELQAQAPSVYVILRQSAEAPGLKVLVVTASPFEAQDYADSAEEIVERVPMPPALRAWVEAFVAEHHEEEAFVKRRRSKDREGDKQLGIGDARVRKATDVYSVPRRAEREVTE
jgi:hypothetical protein